MNKTVALEKTVLLGFCDIAAAGCRALLGFDVAYYGGAEKINYQIPSRNGLGFLDIGLVNCKGGSELDNAFYPLQVINIPSKNVSIIVVNCKPSWRNCHDVVSHLVETLARNNLEQLYILTALLSPGADQNVVYETALFKEKTKEFEEPPKSMRASDDVFNQLMQMLRVAGIPTSCFIATARKAKEGNASRDDGSLATIQTLQALAEELTGVKFNLLTSRDLVYSENNEAPLSNTTNLMYL